jgi:hypothetical protein
MPFPKLHRNTSNQATIRGNTLRKIGSENLTLGDDHAHEIASRIQNTRTALFEMDFKTLIKKLVNREKIVPQRLDKRNTPKSHTLTHLFRAHWKHSTFPIIPKSDVLIGHHQGEAGEPPLISGHLLRATGVDQPKALCASHLQNKNESESEQKTQHWVSTN